MMKRKLRLDRLFITLLLLTIITSLFVVNFDKLKGSEVKIQETLKVAEVVFPEQETSDEVNPYIGAGEDIITHDGRIVSLGEFKLTGYCPCSYCCGEWADGITATQTKATEGRTIAVDPKIIPLGSHVYINGHEYIAEDTGSAINEKRIDIYYDNHSDCFSKECNGYAEVFIIVE